MKKVKNYINGEWVDSKTKEYGDIWCERLRTDGGYGSSEGCLEDRREEENLFLGCVFEDSPS